MQEAGQEELVQVVYDDCMKADISQVTVVYLFLTKFGNSMLVTKLLKGELCHACLGGEGWVWG